MLPFAANGPSTRLTWWLVKTQCLRILSLTQIHVISCSWVSKMQTDKNTIDTIVSCSFSLNATAAPSATALAAWQLLGSTASSWCFYKSKKTCVVSYVPFGSIWRVFSLCDVAICIFQVLKPPIGTMMFCAYFCLFPTWFWPVWPVSDLCLTCDPNGES